MPAGSPHVTATTGDRGGGFVSAWSMVTFTPTSL
jgi:hypothetical protein